MSTATDHVPDPGENLAARLEEDLAALDRELTEIEMLAGQVRAEAARHEQKRAQAAERRHVRVEAGDEVSGDTSGFGHGLAAQSSGIRIQPWRIAYTTAWVRSLTDSLRRIELMWFFTVCSLIDSA